MAELAVQTQRATLLDLIDRLLGKGVVVYGDVILSIADLDLVYLNLRAVLSSIGTLESFETEPPSSFDDLPRAASHLETLVEEVSREAQREKRDGSLGLHSHAERGNEDTKAVSHALRGTQRTVSFSPDTHPVSTVGSPGKRLELDPQKLEQGLAKLVLTLINFLRKLMERQAIRRMEAGTVTPEQMEKAGQAFMRLEKRMQELREQFGLKEEDLNLDLGPLGKLM